MVVWPEPEGEVMVYSIRLSYTNSTSEEMSYQFLTPTTNPWVTLPVMDLPSQRPLWIEVCILLEFMIKYFALWGQEYPHMTLSHKMSTKFMLFRSKQTILEGLHHGAVELSCARMMVGGSSVMLLVIYHTYSFGLKYT